MKTTDPMEVIIEKALLEIEEPFLCDQENGIHLDFYLPNRGVYIEVKQFHSNRIAEQTSRASNVIVTQGRLAVQMLADLLIKSKGAN